MVEETRSDSGIDGTTGPVLPGASSTTVSDQSSSPTSTGPESSQ